MSKAKLTLSELNAGWAIVTLQVDDASYELNGVSFIEDSLEGIVHSGASAVHGTPIDVWFEGEPEQWRLSVSPTEKAGVINIAVHWFPGMVKREPKQLGSPEFSTQCDAIVYARAVRNAFARWKNEQEEYLKCWYNPFPARAFALLEAALPS